MLVGYTVADTRVRLAYAPCCVVTIPGYIRLCYLMHAMRGGQGSANGESPPAWRPGGGGSVLGWESGAQGSQVAGDAALIGSLLQRRPPG